MRFFDTQRREWLELVPRATKRKLPKSVHEVISREDGYAFIPTLPVTEEMLLRHAKRFGLAGIAEVAKAEGINLSSKGGPDRDITTRTKRLKRRRRTDASVRHDVLELHERGRMVAAIADVVNVSERRVREILASARAA